MDQDDDHHELYRLNKPVVSSCPRGHNYIIDQQLVVPSGGNNIIATNTSSNMFRTDGPSVLFDNTGHDIVDHNDNNKMIRNNYHLMKSQIANHPSYPDLLAAYIQCQKIGAPPETASLLEEIDQENHMISSSSSSSTTGLGSDPELDYFMESYCEVLQRLKEELCKPFNEATTFLNKIESQLSKLREGTFTKTTLVQYYGDHSGDDQACDHHGGDEEDHQTMVMSYGDQVDHDHDQAAQILDSSYGGVGLGSGDHDELKEKLLRKYSGYLTTLKTEFLKKRKKVELPKPARSALLHWWNAHSRWPYPTEEEKAKLSEVTGLDQKQINNWFVNQRKRHWKPSDDIKSALVDDLTNHNNSPTKSPHNL